MSILTILFNYIVIYIYGDDMYNKIYIEKEFDSMIEDINLIRKCKKFDDLQPELREVAILRLEHPEASLREIGQMLDEPIGKSGINHRMKKIHDFAEELKKWKRFRRTDKCKDNFWRILVKHHQNT